MTKSHYRLNLIYIFRQHNTTWKLLICGQGITFIYLQ